MLKVLRTGAPRYPIVSVLRPSSVGYRLGTAPYVAPSTPLAVHEPESCASTISTTWAGVCEGWGTKGKERER